MQVRGVHGLVGGTIRGLMHTLLDKKEDMTNEQGCALIQGMDCLARLVQQQPSQNKQRLDAQLPCFRFVTLREETCLGSVDMFRVICRCSHEPKYCPSATPKALLLMPCVMVSYVLLHEHMQPCRTVLQTACLPTTCKPMHRSANSSSHKLITLCWLCLLPACTYIG